MFLCIKGLGKEKPVLQVTGEIKVVDVKCIFLSIMGLSKEKAVLQASNLLIVQVHYMNLRALLGLIESSGFEKRPYIFDFVIIIKMTFDNDL